MAIVISVDGVTVYTITDPLQKVLEYDYPKAKVKNLLINFLQHAIDNKINLSKDNLKEEWIPKIQARFSQMPTQEVPLGQLIFSQPDYLDYDGRNP